MNNLTNIIKKSLLAVGLSAVISSQTGCTIVGTIVSPVTGAVDGATKAYKTHPLLTLPGMAIGCVAGPFVAFPKGIKHDYRAYKKNGSLEWWMWEYDKRDFIDIINLYELPP